MGKSQIINRIKKIIFNSPIINDLGFVVEITPNIINKKQCLGEITIWGYHFQPHFCYIGGETWMGFRDQKSVLTNVGYIESP